MAALGGLQAKIRAAIDRGVLLFIRQSSLRQVRRNTGSPEAQRQQMGYLALYGVQKSAVTEVIARGESARDGADRPVFDRLVRSIEAGEVGLVVVAQYDRLSRNEHDHNRVMEALKKTGGILLVGMNFYDPSDPTHAMLLGIQKVLAEFDNEQRALRISMGRAAKAKLLGYPVSLPTGLVWAAPDDPQYRERLRSAGLESHLKSLDEHQAVFERDGKRYYVLPYPDADVYRSIVLRFQWLYQHRSLPKVIKLMDSTGWPRPGFVPVGTGRVYDPARTVRWVELLQRADGKTPFVRGGLYKWFLSPALYGTYAFLSKRLAAYAGSEELGAQISKLRAFPSIREPDDWDRTREILRGGGKAWKRGEFKGVRTNALDYVRCGKILPDGTCCNKRMSPEHPGQGDKARYSNSRCMGQFGHTAAAPVRMVDEAVRAIVLEAYTPAVLNAMFKRLEVRQGAEEQRLQTLIQQSGETLRQIEYSVHNQERAANLGNHADEDFWNSRRKDLVQKRQRLERERENASARLQEEATVSRDELSNLLKISSDMDRVLRAARTVDGAERTLMAVLVQSVHVATVGERAYWITVTLPSGVRAERVAFSGGIMCSQQQSAFAASELQRWVDPSVRFAQHQQSAEVAKSLCARLEVERGPTGRRGWTPARVWMAAYLHWAQPAPGRDGTSKTLSDIADELGESVDEVLRAALEDRLGPAVTINGAFRLAPTRREIEWAFPNAAGKLAAGLFGWPQDDTVSLLELAVELDLDFERLRPALKASGLARRVPHGMTYYARRTEVLRAAPEPLDLSAGSRCKLDAHSRRHLITQSEGHRILPWTDRPGLSRACQAFHPGAGPAGTRSEYLLLGPEQLVAYRKSSRASAWAALDSTLARLRHTVYGPRRGPSKPERRQRRKAVV